jgi:hypothetical protein
VGFDMPPLVVPLLKLVPLPAWFQAMVACISLSFAGGNDYIPSSTD